MAEIVPTILAATPDEFAARLSELGDVKRIHVDITDGQFAPSQTINLAQVYVPEGVALDLHLMVQDPHSHLHSALALKPSLIIVHAEADGDHQECIADIQSMGVKAGIAYLPATNVNELVTQADHVLIFTGDLGHYGGTLDTSQLHKLAEAKAINTNVETSVDGGVNKSNANEIDADVLYVGSGYKEMMQ